MNTETVRKELPEGWRMEPDGTGAFRSDGSWIFRQSSGLWWAYHAKERGVCQIVAADEPTAYAAAESVDREYPISTEAK